MSANLNTFNAAPGGWLPYPLRDSNDSGSASSTIPCSREKLLAKTLALFIQRQVIPAAQSGLRPDAFANWHKEATGIQRSIYSIDLYYELSAQIQPRIEAPLWSSVERRISAGYAAGNSEIWKAFEDLQSYAEAERRLHVFDPIDTREFESILLLKCADVRIARASSWCYGKRDIGKNEMAFWSLYDQCWELIEDLQDIEEDGRDWNFNFWLYSFMAGRSAITGMESVSGLLKRKFRELAEAWNHLPTGCQPYYYGLVARTRCTIERIETLQQRVLAAIADGQVTPFIECPQRLPLAHVPVSEALV